MALYEHVFIARQDVPNAQVEAMAEEFGTVITEAGGKLGKREFWGLRNLDSVSTANLLEIMEHLNHQEHMTFVFSTHDQRVIDRAHRVITLEDGKIVSDEVRETI